MRAVVFVGPSIRAAVGIGIRSATISFVFCIRAFVVRSVGPAHEALSASISRIICATIESAVTPNIGACAMLQVIHPFTAVDVPLDRGVHSLSITHPMLPATIINRAIIQTQGAISVGAIARSVHPPSVDTNHVIGPRPFLFQHQDVGLIIRCWWARGAGFGYSCSRAQYFGFIGLGVVQFLLQIVILALQHRHAPFESHIGLL
mmetsp:Transcript_5046/g.10431  ORF Transcript_5046/g.10431 Transcript_5046/m.10431 type:complete len:204 (+) Transcript_5046:296-907(+)